ncbi:MAG: CBS domain-containing protein [Planctomycetaceae bacterium]|nr:CBS domain-containing protein [Planctomycetaceae bacterium]
MNKITLGTLITYNPWAVRAETALDEVAAQFETLGVRHVPVVNDDHRLVGIVAEADLLRVRQQQRVVAVGAGGPEEVEKLPELVADVMSRRLVVAGPNDSPRHVLQVLLAHRIRALPVVHDGCLIGMICSRDFLREFSYGELPGSRDPISKSLQAPPEPLEPDTLIDEAYLTMQQMGASCLAVAQGGCPLGVVSLRDIVRARCLAMEVAGEELLPTQLPPVVRIMQRATPVRPGQRLFEAALVMIEENLPAAIVINQANRLMGMITEDDILRVMLDAA